MSILLDALKRSESQRELGSVPTLKTTIDVTANADRNSNTWVPAVMILIAAGMMSWMGWEQYRLPESLTPSSAQQTANTQPSLAESSKGQFVNESANSAGSSGENILPKISSPVADAGNRPSQEEEQQSEQRRVGREFRQYAAEEQAPVASESATEPTRDDSMRQREITSLELDSRQKPVSAINSESIYEPEIISYWQMPESTREGLPDLRISVLVYAEQAENRFLLLNGERLREGDELSNGLLLEEIQRDRAIFNYRNYRFHLKS